MSTGTADRTDLLIRSLSSILPLVNTQVTSPYTAPRSPSSLSSKLNRIALLLVTGGKADAVAVTATVRNGLVILTVASDEPQSLPSAQSQPVITDSPPPPVRGLYVWSVVLLKACR